MATKIISKDEYEQFANSYNSLLENPNKDELLDKLID